MRILQICNKPPYPPVDGGCVAMNAITSGLLANGHSVKIVTVSTQKHPFLPDKIPAEYLKRTAIEAVFIDTSLKIHKGLANLLSSGSYNAERFRSAEFENKLQQILEKEQFDVVHFESIFVGVYLETVKRFSKAKMILRAHNVEHIIWERMARQSINPLKKWYLRFLAKRLKEYELNVLRNFDGIATITKEDKNFFNAEGIEVKTEIFPLGIDAAQYKPAVLNEVEWPSLFHLGSMDWMPNEEGVKWFLEKAWIKIRAEFSQLRLYLAGRNMPHWLKTLEMEGVVIEGAVENAHEFMRRHAVMIVPLLSGGGMRVKIVEGMALGKAIISTTLGAEGIDYTDGENILIADTPEQLAQQVSRCIKNKEMYAILCNNARKHVLAHYDYKEIAHKLTNFYKQL